MTQPQIGAASAKRVRRCLARLVAIWALSIPLCAARGHESAAQDLAYFALHNAAQVAVFDVDKGAIVAHIPVGPLPRSTVARADGTTVFVVNEGNSSISVIETASNTMVETIDIVAVLASNPTIAKDQQQGIGKTAQIVPSPDGSLIYVSCGTQGLAEINRKTRTARGAGLIFGISDCHLAISGDGTKIFLPNVQAPGLSIIDTKSLRLAGTLPGLAHVPFAVSRQDDFAVAFEPVRNEARIARLDDFFTRALSFRNAPDWRGGADPANGAEISPDGKRLFITRAIHPGAERQYRIFGADLASGAVITSASLGKDPPSGIALTPDGRKLVAMVPSLSTVKVYDTATLAELLSATVGPTPMAYRDFVVGRHRGALSTSSAFGRSLKTASVTAPRPQPDPRRTDVAAAHRAYIALNNANQVAVLDLDSGTVLTRIPVGLQPRSTVASADGTTVLAINEGDNTISVIDVAKNRAIETIELNNAISDWGNPGHAVPSPDGTAIYFAGKYAGIIEFNRETRATRRVGLDLGGTPVGASGGHLAVSRDGTKLVFSAMPAQGLSIIDTRSMAASGMLRGPGLAGVPFALSVDGKLAVVAGYSGVIGVGSLDDFSTKTVQFRSAPPSVIGSTYREMLDGIAIAPDGKRIYLTREVGAGGAAHFRIFAVDLATGATVTSASMGKAPTSGIALTRDGRRLVGMVPALGVVKVYDAAMLKELQSIPVGPTPMAFRDFVVGPEATNIAAPPTRSETDGK